MSALEKHYHFGYGYIINIAAFKKEANDTQQNTNNNEDDVDDEKDMYVNLGMRFIEFERRWITKMDTEATTPMCEREHITTKT